MYKIYTLTTVVIFSENVSVVLEGIGRGHHDRITHRKVLRYGSRQPLGAHSHSLQRHRLRHRQVVQLVSARIYEASYYAVSLICYCNEA